MALFCLNGINGERIPAVNRLKALDQSERLIRSESSGGRAYPRRNPAGHPIVTKVKMMPLMYDTINMCYHCDLNEVQSSLNTQTCLWNIKPIGDSAFAKSGKYRNLKVLFFTNKVIIYGSFCKWYFGDNMHSMGRRDMQTVIETMSDELHLPLSKSVVSRIDVAANIIVSYPVKSYLQYLGKLRFFERLEEHNGLRYENKTRVVCFYDKIKKEKKGNIPELYRDTNVLRYEYRLLKGIARQFNMKEVTAEKLYDKDFYNSLLDKWKETYNLIEKLPSLNLEISDIKGTVKGVYSLGLFALLKIFGEDKILSELDTKQKEGKISRRQKFDIKSKFEKAKKENRTLVKESDEIEELNKRISEYIKICR